MSKHTLFVEKYRPDTLDGYIGNEHFIADLQKWITEGNLPNLLLHGSPGTGKTTAAKLIVKNIQCDFIYINCSDENGIDTIRETVKQFASAATFQPIKIVILDEADFLTINAQAALRNIIESFSNTTRFIFTCNFVERIIEPLQSRLTLYELSSPPIKQMAKHLAGILDKESVAFDTKDLSIIVKKTYPDIRRALNTIQGSIRNNKLISTNVGEANYPQQISEALDRKDAFVTIRQIVADNNIKDFNNLYKMLFDKHDDPEFIITIAEYQFQSVTAPDKEINFMGCIAKLTTI
jgi:DNA polymerase III delta prime subunit